MRVAKGKENKISGNSSADFTDFADCRNEFENSQKLRDLLLTTKKRSNKAERQNFVALLFNSSLNVLSASFCERDQEYAQLAPAADCFRQI
jgi:hypothetical protein